MKYNDFFRMYKKKTLPPSPPHTHKHNRQWFTLCGNWGDTFSLERITLLCTPVKMVIK